MSEGEVSEAESDALRRDEKEDAGHTGSGSAD